MRSALYKFKTYLLTYLQLNNILEILDSEADLKVEKSGGVFGEKGERGDDVELLAREKRSLDILSVKKEARLSARALAEVRRNYGIIVCL